MVLVEQINFHQKKNNEQKPVKSGNADALNCPVAAGESALAILDFVQRNDSQHNTHRRQRQKPNGTHAEPIADTGHIIPRRIGLVGRREGETGAFHLRSFMAVALKNMTNCGRFPNG